MKILCDDVIVGNAVSLADVKCGSVQIVAQRVRAEGVAQLGHRLVFDLPDPLTGHPVDLADLIERVLVTVAEPESKRSDSVASTDWR